jgi:hypothetical protein
MENNRLTRKSLKYLDISGKTEMEKSQILLKIISWEKTIMRLSY